MKKMTIDVLPVRLTDGDTETAVSLLVNLGKSTQASCVGAVATDRTLQAISRTNSALNIRYSKDMVTILRGSSSSIYYRKDKSAKEVDKVFDRAFIKAVEKFGHPDTWRGSNRRQVIRFLRRSIMELQGRSFLLTRYDKKIRSGKGHTVDPQTGKVVGGHVKSRTCQTRAKTINDEIARLTPPIS